MDGTATEWCSASLVQYSIEQLKEQPWNDSVEQRIRIYTVAVTFGGV